MAILLLGAIILLAAACLSAIAMRNPARAARSLTVRELADVLLAALAEGDPDLGAHANDVADAATTAARRLGLTQACVDQVSLAAELHDLGKLAIPDQILNKPGPLDPGEWAIMRMHAQIGARILDAMPGMAPIGALVLSSHERHDGCGYPFGLRGDEIPLGSRIIAVCDAYDAMTTQRVYNRPVSPAEALQRLRAASGTQFDPIVVVVVCTAIQEALGGVPTRVSSTPSGHPAPNLKPLPSGTLAA